MKQKIEKAFNTMQEDLKALISPDIHNRMEKAKQIMLDSGELDVLINDNIKQIEEHGEDAFIAYVLSLLVDQTEHSLDCPTCPERKTCTKFPVKILEATT